MNMLHFLDPLREFSFLSAMLRLLLALLCGTFIGYGRSSMQRTAADLPAPERPVIIIVSMKDLLQD